MYSLKRNHGIDIAPAEMSAIKDLFERGLYIQAYERARRIAPLQDWRGTDARILAGRLAGNLGAPRLARGLHACARLGDRNSAEVGYFHALNLWYFRGPFAVWRFFQKSYSFPGATETQLGNLLGLRARMAAQFRDFEQAEKWLKEGEAMNATSSWILCDRANVLEAQDEIEAALEVVREVLRVRPWYRLAVQLAGQYLHLLNRADEARELLAGALSHCESAAIAGQLGTLEIESESYERARAAFLRMREWSPLQEEELKKWLQARLADSSYHLGDLAAAAAEASEVDDPFYKRFAERLTSPILAGRRVHLPVGFVRQHHLTCAPATLSALSRFWKMPVDHDALAAEICYDGTPEHVERHWAEQNGYVAREFRVTWEAAVALLDRGVPFTLTTVEATTAHLQAVIGYDAVRGTLIIRDPYQRIHNEFEVGALLEQYAAFGPRGLALVPKDQASLLEGIELPESEFYDQLFRLQRALHEHRRSRAEEELRALEERDREHRLTVFARKQLAIYDVNLARHLEAVEELLARYPSAAPLQRETLFVLRQLADRSRHRALLHELATSKKADPIFAREWAEELALDARELPMARRFALRALRWRPAEAENVAQFGQLLWSEGQFEKATEVYRLAANLRDKVETFARFYFLAARHVRQADGALAWLEARQAKFEAQSSQPARLLFWALTTLGHYTDAFAQLERALRLRPQDGELLLFAADAFARYGDATRAEDLLGRARERSAGPAWARTAAALADYRCDLKKSLTLWRQVLEAEPLAKDAQQAVTRLTAELEGRAAALEQLRNMSVRFPHHVPLHRLWIEWVRAEGVESSELIIRKALEIDSKDAWTRRELAVCLADQRRYEEAEREALAACAVSPNDPASHSVLGYVAHAIGKLADARQHCRDALRISVDHPGALTTLLEASDSFEEKRASLAFLREELGKQVVFGDGLIAYREAAFTILEPAELLADLRAALKARPDLWHAWSALIRQLTDMLQSEEALNLAQQAVAQFPLFPRLWYDLAMVRNARGETDEEARMLRRAVQINPGWGFVSRALANVFMRQGDRAEEKRILDEAVAASPLDALNFGARAHLLWRSGEKEAALAELEKAIRLDPGFDWAWNSLRSWLLDVGQIERVVALARELTRLRPGEARSWFRLAQALPPGEQEEREKALIRAIELNPRSIDAHDARIQMLANAGRLDEAEAACRPQAFAGELPKELAGRSAWVRSKRGEWAGAIEQMQALLKQWPNYYSGWAWLAEWLGHEQRFDEALAAAKTMTRLAPGSAVALGYQAEAQRHLGEHREASRSLQKAFELDPSYAFAGYSIFNAQLESRERDAAEKTLALLEMHLPGWITLSCRVRFDCAWPNKQRALDGLRELCFVPTHHTAALKEATEAFASAGWRREAERILCAEMAKPGANPEVAARWVESFAARGAWRFRRQLRQLPRGSKLWGHAHFAYIGELGTRKKRRYLSELIRREGEALRIDTPCWGQMSFALVTNNMLKKAAEWVADWREHRDAQAWMLLNASVAFRSQGNDAEAEQVSRHALTISGDHTTRLHQLWLACDEAVSGNYSAARTRLQKISVRGMNPLFETVNALTRGILAVAEAPQLDRKAVFEQQRRELKQPRYQSAFRARSLRQKAKMGVQAMALAAGTRPFHVGGLSWLGGRRFAYPYVWIAIVVVNVLARTLVPDRSTVPSPPQIVSPPAHHSYSTTLPPLPTPAFSVAPDGPLGELKSPDFDNAQLDLNRFSKFPLKPTPTPPRKTGSSK